MAEPQLRRCSCVSTFGHALPQCGQCHGTGDVDVDAVAPPPPLPPPSSPRAKPLPSRREPPPEARQSAPTVTPARLSTSPRTRHISVRRCERCAAFIRKERFDEHLRWEHNTAPPRVYAVRYKAPAPGAPAGPASAARLPRDPDRTRADHHGGIRDVKARFASDPSRDDFSDESDA